VFRNLLLSPNARAEAIPELEVLADDVSAAHGAASAPVDNNQLHYLMSRGLDPQEAESVIVNGFLYDAFTNLTNKELLEEMRTRLTVHLECELKR
jgi:Fe-S cluster assembly protein SufD